MAMAPPIIVTEDTPPDMLAGSMDLTVVLPNGHSLKMSVERSTPMMDLLVQVTTANKISPAGYIIKPLNDQGPLPYKPSTPIGALDAWTIHVVPKQCLSQSSGNKKYIKSINQPFEQTFRLQVHLPRNQLYVARVSPKTKLADILHQVCVEKNLDPVKYSLRHPNNLDQVLRLPCTLADYKLQEVTLVCNQNHPVEVSTADIMSLRREAVNPAYRNTLCEGSVSSGSLEGRSLSPAPSDESSASPPPLPLPPSRPTRKRRPAPKPPIALNEDRQLNGIPSSTAINHSRNSSDSSGYHEASVLSESPQSNNVTEALSKHQMASVSETIALSKSMSDMTAIEPTLKQASSHNSISSLSSNPGRKKKAAPPPPLIISNQTCTIIEDQQQTPSLSSSTSSTTTLDGNQVNMRVKSATLPASSRLNTATVTPPPSPNPSHCSKVEVESQLTPRGRFVSSAYRLIQKTKRKVGRNLNVLGNSFKFKRSSSRTASSKEGENCEDRNVKFKKLVRKNAIKKPNIHPLKNDNENNLKDNSFIPSNSFAACPKTTPLDINKNISSVTNAGYSLYSKKSINVIRNNSVKYKNKFNDPNILNNFKRVNEPDQFKNEPCTSSNLVKFDNFFNCIEFENVNKGVVKCSSFSNKPVVSESLPLRAHSFRVLTDHSKIAHCNNLKTFENFHLKMKNFENSQPNFCEINLNNSKQTFVSSHPVKCNLLAPPPPDLLVNREESLKSWNQFLHQLDDILISNDGAFV